MEMKLIQKLGTNMNLARSIGKRVGSVIVCRLSRRSNSTDQDQQSILIFLQKQIPLAFQGHKNQRGNKLSRELHLKQPRLHQDNYKERKNQFQLRN